MPITRTVTLAARPAGKPTPADFRLETGPTAEPGPGQALLRTIWLSLDPYMRGRMDDARSYAAATGIGDPMPGGCVAEVMASDHPDLAAGDVVVGALGWTSHAVSDGRGLRRIDPAEAPLAAHLGALGMPGHTAWVSLTEIAKGQPGETIVVSAATGAVGQVLGQLARLRGLTAIGVAGGPEKCAWATEALGYHACLDHRAAPDAAALSAAIAEAAPHGVDIYHENTGGKPLAAVLPRMNDHGRIALCGMIAWYSGAGDDALPSPALWRAILTRRLDVRGFIVFDHEATEPAFRAEVAPLLREGRLQTREWITEGLENAPAAFIAMLDGANFGKALVRVGPDPRGDGR